MKCRYDDVALAARATCTKWLQVLFRKRKSGLFIRILTALPVEVQIDLRGAFSSYSSPKLCWRFVLFPTQSAELPLSYFIEPVCRELINFGITCAALNLLLE